MDDPGEYSRRIWEWWRIRMRNNICPSWCLVVRLIVLVQPSSAFMERVFSQLKLIFGSVGDNALEKTIETRLYERINRGKPGYVLQDEI